MTINKNSTNKNVVEIRRELNANGIAVEHIYIDDVKIGIIGYVNDKDKQAAIKAIQTALDGSENVYEAIAKLSTMANFNDKEVTPDEEIEIHGMPCYISYADKALYTSNGEEICNCRELTCELPTEAIKTILIQRAKLGG